MNDIATEGGIRLLEERVDGLEKRELDSLTRDEARARSSIEKLACDFALKSLVAEIAMQLGLGKTEFEERYNERCRYFHDQSLQLISDKLGSFIGGHLDARQLADIPTEDFKPLFPANE
jgi:hypothetical protein